ncbi:MAG: peptidoglycan-binding protein [Pseudomonadota bacterium]
MRKLALSITTALTTTLAGGAALAEGAALVIGNADYAHAPRALSAERDSEAVADALRGAGFEVVQGLDLDRAGMRALMNQFAVASIGAEQIVIYYSGHAMRMQGETYLAPVDFNPTSPVAAALDGATLATLEALAATRPGASILFVDGAQLNGFDATAFAEPGLAELDAPEGVLIVSAAEPGRAVRRSRWRRSGFANAVIDRFLEEDAAAMDVARELDAPIWTTGAIDEEVVLVPAPEPEPVAAAAISEVAQQIELAFWQSTEAAGGRADYEAYLARYPQGLFAAIARNRLADLGVSAPSAPAAAVQPAQTSGPTQADRDKAVEDALRLSRSERRRIQGDLTELGFDTNGVDGIFGRGTRGAVRRWQEVEGLPVSGYLDGPQIAILRSAAQTAIDERERLAAETARLSKAEAQRREDQFWARTRAINTYAAYQRYLVAYPEGAYADDARTVIAAIDSREASQVWARAAEADTEEAYADYLDRYPTGANRDQAQARYDALVNARLKTARAEEDALWLEAEKTNSADLYADYLARFPEGRYAAQAKIRYERLTNTAVALPDASEDAKAWDDAQRADNMKAYRSYVETYPNGRYVEYAQDRMTQLVDATRQNRENKLKLDRDSWRSIEARLEALGHDTGPVDGRVKPKTRNAIAAYRKGRGLPVHAYVDKDFIEALVADTGGANQGGGSVVNDIIRILRN